MGQNCTLLTDAYIFTDVLNYVDGEVIVIYESWINYAKFSYF